MNDIRSSLHGLWLPLVTPFRDGELDEASLRRLARHYAGMPVKGLVLAATTGESLTLEAAETERLVETVADSTLNVALPIAFRSSSLGSAIWPRSSCARTSPAIRST